MTIAPTEPTTPTQKTAWKYARASVVGTSHAKGGGGCQDASECRLFVDSGGGQVLVAVASDGAGSAAHSAEGARLACALFLREMASFFGAGGGRVETVTLSLVTDWLGQFRAEIRRVAQTKHTKPGDYACTFLAAIVGPRDAAFVQVGDGAIVIAEAHAPDKYRHVFWPQTGEYENMTNFATGVESWLQVEFDARQGVVEEVALFSDGLQRLALDFTRRAPHAPFFRPMFLPLRAATAGDDGEVAPLSDALRDYLASDRINERTDDDKTLILATRRPKMDDGPG